jgi:hypothetical protein
MSEADPSTHLLELGFDSLFLTQVAQFLMSKFGLKITFRQLLDRFSTLDSLTTEIDASFPAGAFCEVLPTEPPLSMTTPPSEESRFLSEPQAPHAATAMGSSVVDAIVREQLQEMSQLMARQLAMLQGTGVRVESQAAIPPLPQLAQAFKQSINEMQAGGVLPALPRRDLAIPSVIPAPDLHLGVEAPLTESQLEIWPSARISDEANCAYE